MTDKNRMAPDDFPEDFAIDPPQPPEWLVRAELRDLAALPPEDPVRIRRIRALYGLPAERKEEP